MVRGLTGSTGGTAGAGVGDRGGKTGGFTLGGLSICLIAARGAE